MCEVFEMKRDTGCDVNFQGESYVGLRHMSVLDNRLLLMPAARLSGPYQNNGP
jgi:hypothetical protein